MKAVLISIKPKWCELIASGIKTVEIRKNRPKIETPFKVYIYQTKFPWVYDTYSKIANWQQKVIGEFICDNIIDIYKKSGSRFWGLEKYEKDSCLTAKEIGVYGNGNDLYGWHISGLKIYNTPKDLCDFYTICPEWEKEEFTAKCYDCENYYENYDECFADCAIEGEKRIVRPPQSWCYADEE